MKEPTSDQILQNEELLSSLTDQVLLFIKKFKNKKIKFYFENKSFSEIKELIKEELKNEETTNPNKIAKSLKEWYIQECVAEQESLNDSDY